MPLFNQYWRLEKEVYSLCLEETSATGVCHINMHFK